MERGRDVIEIVFERLLHRFTDVAERGEVHDQLDPLLPQHPSHRRFIAEVRHMELHPGRDGPAVAVGQVVQHDWPVAGSGQLPDTVAADITRTAV